MTRPRCERATQPRVVNWWVRDAYVPPPGRYTFGKMPQRARLRLDVALHVVLWAGLFVRPAFPSPALTLDHLRVFREWVAPILRPFCGQPDTQEIREACVAAARLAVDTAPFLRFVNARETQLRGARVHFTVIDDVGPPPA